MRAGSLPRVDVVTDVLRLLQNSPEEKFVAFRSEIDRGLAALDVLDHLISRSCQL